MLKKLAIGAAALISAVAFATSSPAQSTPRCESDINILINDMKNKYGEAPMFSGVSNQGYGMLFLVNPVTGTWTVIYSGGGNHCIVSFGEALTTVPQGDPA